MPVSLVLGRSSTRNAAKLAVYDATMIMANPAHTIPRTRAEKLRGVPTSSINVSCDLRAKKINFCNALLHLTL